MHDYTTKCKYTEANPFVNSFDYKFLSLLFQYKTKKATKIGKCEWHNNILKHPHPWIVLHAKIFQGMYVVLIKDLLDDIVSIFVIFQAI